MATPKKIQHIWVWKASGYSFNAGDKVLAAVPFGSAALNLTAGDGSVVAAWADIASADSYDIEYDTSPLFDSPATQVNGAISPLQISATNGVPLYVRLRAVIAAVPEDWLPAVTATPDGSAHDLWPHKAAYPEIRRRTDQLPVMTVEVLPTSAFIKGELLRFRQRLYVVYDDGSHEPFRISQIKGRRLTCASMLADLGATQFRFVRATDGEMTRILPLRAIGLDSGANNSALDLLLDPDHGVPAPFSKGSVLAAFQAVPVRFDANYTSHWDLLTSFCQQVEEATGKTCEIEPTFAGDPSDGDPGPTITINIYYQEGWTAAERAAGVPDPTLRTIDEPTGCAVANQGNLLALRGEADQRDFFSRIIPVGGDPSSRVGIAGVKWPVASKSGNVFTMEDNVIPFGGMYEPPNGFYVIGDEQVGYPVQWTTAPNTIEVAGALGHNDTWLTLLAPQLATGGFGYADFIPHPAAEAEAGVVERTVDFPEVPPYPNLITELLGLEGDMSFAGTPAGFDEGGGTVTDVDLGDLEGPLYISFGPQVKKIELDVGEYRRFGPIDLADLITRAAPYFSFWLAARVTSGRVRASFLDAEGTYHPEGEEKVELVADQTAEFGLGGMEPAAGNCYLHLEALEDGTVFYLDAATWTQSVGPWRYANGMGRKALYFAAAAVLKREGGLKEPNYETDFIDLSQVESLLAEETEVRLGSWVRVRAHYLSGSSAYLKQFDARVVELVETDAPNGRFLKKVRLETPTPGAALIDALSFRTRPDVTRRLLPEQAASNPPLAPLASVPPAQSGVIVPPPFWLISAYDVLGTIADAASPASPNLLAPTIGTVQLQNWNGNGNFIAATSDFGHTDGAALIKCPAGDEIIFVGNERDDDLKFFTIAFGYKLDGVGPEDLLFMSDRFFADGEIAIIDATTGASKLWDVFISWNGYSDYEYAYGVDDSVIPLEGTLVVSAAPTGTVIYANGAVAHAAAGGPKISPWRSVLFNAGSGTHVDKWLHHMELYHAAVDAAWAEAFHTRYFD